MHSARWGDWKSQGMQRSKLQQEKKLKGGGVQQEHCSNRGGGHWKLQGVQRPQLKQENGSQSATRIRLNAGGGSEKMV